MGKSNNKRKIIVRFFLIQIALWLSRFLSKLAGWRMNVFFFIYIWIDILNVNIGFYSYKKYTCMFRLSFILAFSVYVNWDLIEYICLYWDIGLWICRCVLRNKVHIVFIRGLYTVINCYGGFCFPININQLVYTWQEPFFLFFLPYLRN